MEEPPKTLPIWPFGEPNPAEILAWADLWTRPAASLWQRFGLTHEAAIHVRTLIAFADGGSTNAALGGLVARQAESLGLTVTGAARNRWTWPMQAPAAALARDSRSGSFRPGMDRTRPSARSRFTVIAQADPNDYDAHTSSDDFPEDPS